MFYEFMQVVGSTGSHKIGGGQRKRVAIKVEAHFFAVYCYDLILDFQCRWWTARGPA
jgi:hypothetical protein